MSRINAIPTTAILQLKRDLGGWVLKLCLSMPAFLIWHKGMYVWKLCFATYMPQLYSKMVVVWIESIPLFSIVKATLSTFECVCGEWSYLWHDHGEWVICYYFRVKFLWKYFMYSNASSLILYCLSIEQLVIYHCNQMSDLVLLHRGGGGGWHSCLFIVYICVTRGFQNIP